METITCPSGHTLPVEQIKSYVDQTKEDIDEAITFDCPGGKRGHQFSLKKAEAKGMFTENEAAKIRQMGTLYKKQFT